MCDGCGRCGEIARAFAFDPRKEPGHLVCDRTALGRQANDERAAVVHGGFALRAPTGDEAIDDVRQRRAPVTESSMQVAHRQSVLRGEEKEYERFGLREPAFERRVGCKRKGVHGLMDEWKNAGSAVHTI